MVVSSNLPVRVFFVYLLVSIQTKLISDMKTNVDLLESFDPNGLAVANGHFIGLPFEEDFSDLVLLSVPWDVTVSYGAGTATAADNILRASTQLDLYLPDFPAVWKRGIHLRDMDENWLATNTYLRPIAKAYINFLEAGGNIAGNEEFSYNLNMLNSRCKELKNWVRQGTKDLLEQDKKVGIVGGDHSVALGFIEALAERYDDFGILQIDAHMDLRETYEGFIYSHASIFYNALQIPQLSKLVQVGVRDYCEAEQQLVQNSNNRVEVFLDQDLKRAGYQGKNFATISEEIVQKLPQNVYISFDIDGLDPKLCPHTGTPVPGGLELQEAFYLLHLLHKYQKNIIGFDLCEVAGGNNEWDGNVGARVLYQLSALMLAGSAED